MILISHTKITKKYQDFLKDTQFSGRKKIFYEKIIISNESAETQLLNGTLITRSGCLSLENELFEVVLLDWVLANGGSVLLYWSTLVFS